MNKEEYADKFMSRAKQDIKMCENEHELQLYIAGLLENIDYWQNEYDYMKKYRDNLQQENNQLKEKLDKYENPEDMTLMMMWATDKVKDENKQLKRRIETSLKEIDELQQAIFGLEEVNVNWVYNDLQKIVDRLKGDNNE